MLSHKLVLLVFFSASCWSNIKRSIDGIYQHMNVNVNVNVNVISSFHHLHYYHHYNGETEEKIRNRLNGIATKRSGMEWAFQPMVCCKTHLSDVTHSSPFSLFYFHSVILFELQCCDVNANKMRAYTHTHSRTVYCSHFFSKNSPASALLFSIHPMLVHINI